MSLFRDDERSWSGFQLLFEDPTRFPSRIVGRRDVINSVYGEILAVWAQAQGLAAYLIVRLDTTQVESPRFHWHRVNDDLHTVSVEIAVDLGIFAEDPVQAALELVAQCQGIVDQWAHKLALPVPPRIPLTRREREWLEAGNTAPEVQVVSIDLGFVPESIASNVRRPEGLEVGDPPLVCVSLEEPVSPERMFEVLAPTTDAEANFDGLWDRLEEIPEEEHLALELAVQDAVAQWQEAEAEVTGIHCATDSGAMLAMSLLMGGKGFWEEALRNPADYRDQCPIDPGCAEDVLIHFGM